MSARALVEPTEIARGSKRSFLLSLVATLSVAVVPTFFVFAVLVFSQPEPMIVLAVLLSILLTAGAVVVGSAIWARQPESEGLAFGDLMLWSWVRQYRAEQTLVDATATLGFDRSGRFLGHSTAPKEEQVRAIHAIAKALDAKSSYTLGHSRRVQRHARRVAEALALSKEDTHSLAMAALLHDVGNVVLSDEVLRKAGQLTIEERSRIEAHVLIGARMVEMAGDNDVVQGIRHHHERWDGDGYPDHMSGGQIPLFSRVVAIAEAFDAMTSTRPYRQSLSKAAAIEVLRAESGFQFDGDLVETFVATVRKPFGLVERFPFLAAAASQLRELGLMFRRIGAVAMSATASTIAIALILGSTVLSPGTPKQGASKVAERSEPTEPIDGVLGIRVGNADEAVGAVSDAVAATEDSATSIEDQVLGIRVAQDPVRVASVEGDPVKFDGGTGGNGGGTTNPPGGGTTNPPGGGTTNPPGGGTTNPPGGGTTNPPVDGNNTNPPGGGTTNPPGGGTTNPPGGGTTNPPGGGTTTPPPGGGNGGGNPDGGTDKNPGAPGNGYGNENAPGQNKDDGGAPGNSGNAPGQNKDDGSAPGNSGAAPGQNKDDSSAPGNSGAAPGQNKEEDAAPVAAAPGKSAEAPGQNKEAVVPADAPGNSEEAPGLNKDVVDEDTGTV